MAGSMTAASRVLREAITYDAHPQRSLRTCLKYIPALSSGERVSAHGKSMEARQRGHVPHWDAFVSYFPAKTCVMHHDHPVAACILRSLGHRSLDFASLVTNRNL